ncbi:MAG: hypothetical protein ACE5FG_05215 [Myxococcota bacterium]
MRRASRRLLAILPLLIGTLAGCPEPTHAPRYFSLIPLEEARARLSEGGVSLIEAEAGPGGSRSLPGALLWRIPPGPTAPIPPEELPSGGVLLVAPRDRIGFRAAAALSRAGNHPVFLCILENAEDRSDLYALALQAKENARGRDS